MAPRGKVALFVCPSTPFFLDTLGLRHGDLKESAQKSYVLNQDFPFNHLSKRKRASPAHVSFKTVNCFSILGFLSCLVHLALTVKINENYIKIHRYQQRTASVFEIIFPFSRTRALFFPLQLADKCIDHLIDFFNMSKDEFKNANQLIQGEHFKYLPPKVYENWKANKEEK